MLYVASKACIELLEKVEQDVAIDYGELYNVLKTSTEATK